LSAKRRRSDTPHQRSQIEQISSLLRMYSPQRKSAAGESKPQVFTLF
jgi:hypothetical protein